VGAASTPSPIGTFTIVNRIPNPTYYRPGKVVGPGAANPLGTRWIGLSEKGYGIHGTDNPRSIGYAKSHGCIRLRNADVERLFERVRAGDVVELHAELRLTSHCFSAGAGFSNALSWRLTWCS
jgi:lipoprotein-anchoring transpeptidase ErfK/SrfK